MTECQRFIKEGRFCADFFKPEIRSGFQVTEQRKKIWAVEIDALLELSRVCERFGLKYCLGFGALLGAIRHGGFIPWDDDIDVLMPRKDYDRLFDLSMEFREPYFLQTPYTDPGAVFSTIRLRNSNSTWMVKAFSAERFNHGLGIDIFPLDYWHFSGEEEAESEMARIIFDNSTYMRRNQSSKDCETVNRVAEYLKRKGETSALHDFERLQESARKYINSPTDCLAVLCITAYPYEKQKFNSSAFGSLVNVNFEGFQIPVPSGYDHVLSRLYNDYLELPPLESRGAWHSKLIINPDVPYGHFLDGKSG